MRGCNKFAQNVFKHCALDVERRQINDQISDGRTDGHKLKDGQIACPARWNVVYILAHLIYLVPEKGQKCQQKLIYKFHARLR